MAITLSPSNPNNFVLHLTMNSHTIEKKKKERKKMTIHERERLRDCEVKTLRVATSQGQGHSVIFLCCTKIKVGANYKTPLSFNVSQSCFWFFQYVQFFHHSLVEP